MQTFSKNLSQRLIELGIELPDTNLSFSVYDRVNYETIKIPLLSLSNLLCLLSSLGEKMEGIDNRTVEYDLPKHKSHCFSVNVKASKVKRRVSSKPTPVSIARNLSMIFILSKSDEELAYEKSEEYLINLIK